MQVLRGYVGDKSAQPIFEGTQLGSLFDIVGQGYQRPFELATLRLFNMVGTLVCCSALRYCALLDAVLFCAVLHVQCFTCRVLNVLCFMCCASAPSSAGHPGRLVSAACAAAAPLCGAGRGAGHCVGIQKQWSAGQLGGWGV